MEEALADPSATGIGNHPLLLAYLGEAHLLSGRPDDALAVARRPSTSRTGRGTGQRSLGPASPRRDRRAGRPARARVCRSALRPGARPGRRTGHATPRRPLPPRPWEALQPYPRPTLHCWWAGTGSSGRSPPEADRTKAFESRWRWDGHRGRPPHRGVRRRWPRVHRPGRASIRP